MATHMIPRNTKGEGRILYIFSTKAIIYMAIGLVIGLPFYFIFDAVKDWEKECEMALRRGTAENNKIGSMFILKAKYGYRETAPVPAPETLQVLPTSELPKLNIKKTPPKIKSGAED